ncbi:MAG TPA: sensor histidine kinase [Actinomycetota bacterium]|nr:sensor histidine kinase [Actinomycetota bacterium]
MQEGAGRPPRARVSPWVFDSMLAVAAAALSISLFASELSPAGLPGGVVVLGYALALLHTLALAARRRFPLAVLATSLASGLAFAAIGLPTFVLGPAILVPVYTVAAYCEWRASLAGLAAAELALAAVQLTPAEAELSTWVGNTLVLAAAWLLGNFVGDRRAYATQLEERTAELEQAREDLARRAVAEERLRLARELHDVVAHSMSVIAVQSGVGAHVAATQPEEARKALAAIETISRAALEELRRLLGVLRQDDGDEPQGSLAPVPGLADLDTLLAQVAKAGLAVKLRVEGTRPELPAGVDLSAYRIVQEALTNVVKHAGPARAQVVVCYGDQEVAVEVTDNGKGVAPAGDGRTAKVGHGIIGMRERVALFGGDLEAGPRPGGGFRVAARLPFTADRP